MKKTSFVFETKEVFSMVTRRGFEPLNASVKGW